VAKTAGAAPGTPENRATLLFQLGSSYFLLGQEKDCIPQLDAYLAGYGGGHYAPYASLILAKALRTTGDAGRSKSVAQAALAKYKGSDVEGELASLAQ
jgi:hypothetical protein